MPHFKNQAVDPDFKKDQSNSDNDTINSYGAALMSFLMRSLVEANLSGATYRVALDFFSRCLTNKQHTEALPLEFVAQKLGLGRNAVGKAYAALDSAGLIRRIAVCQRGAPTRTTLAGIALKTYESIRAATTIEAVVRENAGFTDTCRVLDNVSRVTCHVSQESLTEDSMSKTAQAHRDEQNPIQGCTNPAIVEDIPVEKFTEECHASVRTKVPAAALYAVMKGDFRAGEIDPSWQLSPIEARCLLSLLPRREKKPLGPEKAPPKAALGLVPTTARPDIAQAVQAVAPRLCQIVGEQRAAIVMDELAFSVTHGGLGRGDVAVGIRVAISILARGTWSTPKGYSKDWSGAVARGLIASFVGASLPSEGDALKKVR